MPGLLNEAVRRGEAYNVAMNAVVFISFNSASQVRGIGTADLNSCTAVMIVSSSGAILAHIAPRSSNARRDDPNAGDRHVTQKMDEMGALYKKHRAHFSVNDSSWIVSAFYYGELALPSQHNIITSKLQVWGLNPTSENYAVVQPPLPPNGKGTVFIDARDGGFPVVYVEDRPVHAPLQASAADVLLGAPSSSSWGTYSSNLQAAGSSGFDVASGSGLGSSSALQPLRSSKAPETPHYFVHDKKYYWYEEGESNPVGEVPINAWDYNPNGWSKSPGGEKWRWWNGKKATFSDSG